MKFIDPRTDFAFKKIFGNENAKDILISFLNAVLDLKKGYQITEVEILNPYKAPKLQFSKDTFVDVRCTDERKVCYIVEMQVQYVKGFEKRVIYNASKAYSNQINEGEEYPKLNQVLSINILDFILFDDIKDRYITTHLLKEHITNSSYIDEIRYYFIELPKFTKNEEEIESKLEKWIYFIKYAGSLKVVPEKLNTDIYNKAFEIANTATMTKEEWWYYDAMSMKIQDERGAVEAAEEKGYKIGKIEGETKGKIEVVRNMKREGIDIAVISRWTGLSEDEVIRIE